MVVDVARVKSGVPGFDKAVEGGFKQGSISLLCGPAGSGKTTFCAQFLLEGFKAGEPAVYITFEEKKEKLYADMLAFGWDFAHYEEMGLFKFVEYTPEQIKRVLVEGGGTIDALVTQMNAKRMVIDSITSFTLLYQNELNQKEASLALFELINKWGCTALLTSQSPHNPEQLAGAFQYEVDGILLFYHFREKGHRKRALEVLKMRGTSTPEKVMKLDLGKKGLILYPETVQELPK